MLKVSGKRFVVNDFGPGADIDYQKIHIVGASSMKMQTSIVMLVIYMIVSENISFATDILIKRKTFAETS